MGREDKAWCVAYATEIRPFTNLCLYSPANQFRALEEDEIMFLDSLREKQEAEELERKQRDGEELQSFKQ